MIISIRGTNGSGKSTLVKSILARYRVEPQYEPGRKRPIGYIGERQGGGRPVFVPGHYEKPTGGCDTIRTPDDAYALVRRYASEQYDVVFEGIMVQDDVRRAVEVASEHPMYVVILDVPIETCLESVAERRRIRGDERELNPKNTVNRAKTMKSVARRLAENGVDVRTLGRSEALETCLSWLGLESAPIVSEEPTRREDTLW